MNTSMRLLGATLGATAIVGSSAVAANACDFGGHDNTDGTTSSPQGQFGAAATESDDDHADWGGHEFSYGHHFGHEFGHHFGHGWADDQTGDEDEAGDTQSSDQSVSFEDKQAAIVQRLTDADSKLSDLISQASTAAADDPEGEAAQQLADLQAKQAKLESLIDAVKAASDWQELAAAFQDAGQSTSTTEPPAGTDTSTTSTTPVAPAA